MSRVALSRRGVYFILCGGLIPLVNVKGKVFSNGFCGPITKTIHTTYWAWMRQPEYSTEITYAT